MIVWIWVKREGVIFGRCWGMVIGDRIGVGFVKDQHQFYLRSVEGSNATVSETILMVNALTNVKIIRNKKLTFTYAFTIRKYQPGRGK